MKPNSAQSELRRQYIELRDSNAQNFHDISRLLLKVYDKQLFALEDVSDRSELTIEYKKQRDATAQKFRDTQELLKWEFERQFRELEEK